MPNRKSEMTNETKNLIIGMFKAGRKPFVIAKELNINRSTVYKFRKRYKETGSIENKGRTERPPKWTKRDNNQLSVLVEKNKKATVRKIWRLFNEERTATVCLETIRLKLRSLGLIRRSIKKSEFICRRNRIKRIKFAKTYMKWTADDWKKVIFSDESQFVIEEPKRAKIWRKSGEKYSHHDHNASSSQKNIRVMVWGCITGSGIGSLTQVKGAINSEKYVSVLEDNLIPVIAEKYDWQSFFSWRTTQDLIRLLPPKHTLKIGVFQKLDGPLDLQTSNRLRMSG